MMEHAERFEVELPSDLAQFVRSQVGRGGFGSDVDVVRDAVRQAAGAESLRDASRSRIAAGVASLRAGKGVDGESFMAALDAGLAEEERQGL